MWRRWEWDEGANRMIQRNIVIPGTEAGGSRSTQRRPSSHLAFIGVAFLTHLPLRVRHQSLCPPPLEPPLPPQERRRLSHKAQKRRIGKKKEREKKRSSFADLEAVGAVEWNKQGL